KRPLVENARAETSDNVGVRERSDGFHFAFEAHQEFFVLGQARGQNLDRDGGIVLRVERLVDGAHAAAADGAEYLQLADRQTGRQLIGDHFAPALLFEENFLNGAQFKLAPFDENLADTPDRTS